MQLDQIQRLSSFFETMDPTLNVQQLRSITWILEQFEDPSVTEVPIARFITATGLTKAGASRTCSYFGSRRHSKMPGLGLLDRVVDDEDTRTRNIVLTPKGRAVLRQLKEL